MDENVRDAAARLVKSEFTRRLNEGVAGHRLTETSLSRVWKFWKERPFAILTAWRSDKTTEENRRNLHQLKDRLRARGYGYVPLLGRWKDPADPDAPVTEEPSLFVPAREGGEGPEGLRALALQLAQEYNQDGIVWADGEKAYIIDTKEKPGEATMTFSQLRTDPTFIWSELKRKPGRTFRFEGLYFAAPPKSAVEAMTRQAQGDLSVQSAYTLR